MNKILLTGAAGFIGAALTSKFLKCGYKVIGLDNLNNYYEVKLKQDRLKNIEVDNFKFISNWVFEKCDLVNCDQLEQVFFKHKPDIVVNLAAQAGVRYSLQNPNAYISSNIIGFYNIIELCREYKVKNFIFASSSSVYGSNSKLPFSEDQTVNHPINLYGATKISNEVIAHSYSYLYRIPTTGLRFFTVYGPWGRPDMAPFIFTKLIIEGKEILINKMGNMMRDFTYIDDIVEGIFRCAEKPAEPKNNYSRKEYDPSVSDAPFRLFNIGNGDPIRIIDFVEILEEVIQIKAIKEFNPNTIGEMDSTEADTSKLIEWIKFKPSIELREGVKHFVKWFKEYYKI